ncbi:hypothetical protein FEF22_000370 [Texas Phoenix palm phytoplasma]|uniref:Phosphate propanoyltransferase n=1 Tax=Texas Phoenix palm phytoplasma TaxID=176709 RepID=A0ABS5BI36_9MOLU|nr:hypothetical protein [Texas Phoenix palm phytoplasma]
MKKMIPVGISGRHLHVTQKTLDILFGCENYKLTVFKELKQKGQFAAEEKIDVMSKSGSIIKGVRLMIPVRNVDQLELSKSDCLRHKFNAPVRSSGDIKNSDGAILIGPKGQLEINEGVIISDRARNDA